MVESRRMEVARHSISAMVEPSDDPRLSELRARIQELNNKSARVLIFLGFGIAAVVLLWSTDVVTDIQQDLLLRAMRWWVLAIFPAVTGILPLKEIRENNLSWYSFVRWSKFVLLWLAVICIVVGTAYFIRSTLVAQPPDNTQSTMLRSAPGVGRRDFHEQARQITPARAR